MRNLGLVLIQNFRQSKATTYVLPNQNRQLGQQAKGTLRNYEHKPALLGIVQTAIKPFAQIVKKNCCKGAREVLRRIMKVIIKKCKRSLSPKSTIGSLRIIARLYLLRVHSMLIFFEYCWAYKLNNTRMIIVNERTKQIARCTLRWRRSERQRRQELFVSIKAVHTKLRRSLYPSRVSLQLRNNRVITSSIYRNDINTFALPAWRPESPTY